MELPEEIVSKIKSKYGKAEVKKATKLELPDSIKERAAATAQERNEDLVSLSVEVGEGITLGALGELAAIAQAATSEKTYREARNEYEGARDQFKRENPRYAALALPMELLASIPTGIGVFKTLTKAGIKSTAVAGAVESGSYGFLSGEGFEERVGLATGGALAGYTLGKIVDVAFKPTAAGGLRTKADDLADDSLDVDDVAMQRALDQERYVEFDVPIYSQKPLREAATVGEFWDSATGAIRKFYDDKITGVSDEIARRIPVAGFRFQRADETALREINKKLDGIAEDLVPVIRIVNESPRVKGILLDYGAGMLGKIDDAIPRLKAEFMEDMTEAQLDVLEQYLRISAKKNDELNAKVFGATFKYPTYLHTRNNASRAKMKAEGMTDEQIERKVFTDPGMEKRSRGSYLKGGDDAPVVSDYDNPLLSDMQRMFQMEKFYQLGRVFGTKTEMENILAPRRAMADEDAIVALTPKEVMDTIFNTLVKRGVSNDGAEYAVKKMTDSILGANKAPHPLIQAASSASYATTLAGPMSAVLNIADIPLLGAKYGGRAMLEGMKSLTPFKKIPDVDLKKAGLNNQTMGEFTDKINDEMRDGAQSFLTRMASTVRKGTDFAMKGSGFAAMDRVGKKGVIRGVLRSAADDAEAGRLADNWGFYFNKEELKLIEQQLLKHGMDHTKYSGQGGNLVEELMFAGLGQQQLISSAGRPAAWARNPNLRPLWALRGFVVKQQALALREVVGNIKAGKPEKAAEFLGRYALYGAGGYAVINEGRQFVFGDGEVSASGLLRGYGDAWASLLTANTLGLNDYQFGQIQKNGILPTIAEGLMPIAISRPLDIGGKIVEAIDGEALTREVFVDALPAVKQSARFGRNVGGLFGLDELERQSEEVLRRQD